MHPILTDFFAEEKIEYYALARYDRLRKTMPELTERDGIEPKTAILFLVPYYTVTPTNISRYAASRDYHLVIRDIGDRLIERLKGAFPNAKFKTYGDHSPLDERSAALTSGLGIVGDNGLLINEKYGSYIFIADVLCDLPIDVLGEQTLTEVKSCIHCGKCKASCPTGILRGCGTDCLSAITQRKGELSLAEQEMMRAYNTAWGCDLCQSVCPYNQNPAVTPIPFFHRNIISDLTKERLCAMDKSEFKSRAFSWRGRKVIERNLDILSKNNKK